MSVSSARSFCVATAILAFAAGGWTAGRPVPLEIWGPGFNAQNPMLDEHSEKYDLEDVDWRPEKPWYEEEK